MTTLKKNKVLQLFMGTAFAIALLFVGYLLSEKIDFPETPFWRIAEIVLLIGYLLMYMGALSLLALFSKSQDLKFLYYPTFAICLNCVASAIFHYNFESRIWIVLIPLPKYFGMPLLSFAKALDKETTYNTHYGYDETVFWQYNTLGILLVMTLISLVVYQIYTETEEQAVKKSRWYLQGSARTTALAMIFSYGMFTLFIFFLDFSYDLLPSALVIVADVVYAILAHIVMTLTISFLTFILPVVLIPYLIILSSKQAISTRNPRQVFNPLVFLAIFLTIVGTWAIYTTTMQCF